MEWISVKDRLPKEMGYCICLMDDTPGLGKRVDIVFYAIREYGSMAVEKTGWGIPVLYDWANHEVTHWMPLPNPLSE